MGVRIKASGGRFSLVRRVGGLKRSFALSPQEGAVTVHVLFCFGILPGHECHLFVAVSIFALIAVRFRQYNP